MSIDFFVLLTFYSQPSTEEVATPNSKRLITLVEMSG